MHWVPKKYLGASFVLVFISNFSGSIKVLFWPSTFHQTVNVLTWLLPRSSGAGSWHGASQLLSSWSDFYPGVLGSGQLWLFVTKMHPKVLPSVPWWRSQSFLLRYLWKIYTYTFLDQCNTRLRWLWLTMLWKALMGDKGTKWPCAELWTLLFFC